MTLESCDFSFTQTKLVTFDPLLCCIGDGGEGDSKLQACDDGAINCVQTLTKCGRDLGDNKIM